MESVIRPVIHEFYDRSVPGNTRAGYISISHINYGTCAAK